MKVMEKQGKPLDTSKACLAKGTRTSHLCCPQEEEEEEDQEGGATPQMTMTMTGGIVMSAEKRTWHELQITLSDLIN